MNSTTSWVKPTEAITGLDHLGAHAPCIAIYSQLLPGITNVTDRATYYSFYPWLLREIEMRRGTDLSPDTFKSMLRRAECLFGLLATRHEIQTDGVAQRHGQGMVGRQKFAPAVKLDGPLDLAGFSAFDGPKRYFKNPHGGLAQYYLGVMRDLGILAGSTRDGLRYVRESTAPLADAFDGRVDADLFFAVMEQDVVSAGDLDDLADFCPCGLRGNQRDREALLDVLFDRRASPDAAGHQRRASLLLILHLAIALADENGKEFGLNDETFRAATYTGHLEDEVEWNVPVSLQATRRAWATYQRNEILSVAVQGIFWACLDLCRDVDTPADSRVLGSAFRDLVSDEALGFAAGSVFRDAVAHAKITQPALGNWASADHELQLAWEVASAHRNADNGAARIEVTRSAVGALIALAARTQNADAPAPYDGVLLSEGYLDDYPINLSAFGKYVASETWMSMTLGQLTRWLATDWGLDVHFQVALRKLRHQGNDTFRIRPTDEGLKLVDAPPPVFTSPRFRQAVQILADVGALDLDETGSARATQLGRALVQELS